MALPKEPRQKMINLMYLVLTALLALNVSAEILNAFRTVNNSLEATNKVVAISTDTYIKSLQEKLNKPETKDSAKVWLEKAQKIVSMADVAYNNVQQLKDSILRATGFNPEKNKDSSFKEDDIDAAQRIIVEGGEGKKLFATLQTFKNGVLNVDPAITNDLGKNFPVNLEAPKTKNEDKRWEAAYFHMTPTLAALTILSKFQNDVRTAENKAVEICHNKVGHVEVIINNFQPIVEQSATYIMNGEPMSVIAGLGAFNSERKPTVTIDGVTQPINDSGFVRKSFTASGIGSHTVHIVINYVDQNNQARTLPKDITYVVGEPTGVSISADDVEVLYVDLPNHISINAGVGAEKIHPSIDNGTLEKGESAGVFIVHPARAGTPATLTVNIDGRKPFTKTFKVRSVPDPVAMVGGNKGGRMRVNEFKAQFGVQAILENFIFQGVKFDVTSYTLVMTGVGFNPLKYADVKGASFDPVRNDMVEKAQIGTTVTIDNIRVSGPGGSRLLPPIVFNLY
ncbi:MAG TPA: gliding motility protein GldM [Chitinophagaceae bacterium]|nr:gliding motility protein GldM [Chitinophagaceae bacterium]